MELDESIMAGIVVVGYQFTLGGEVYEITRIKSVEHYEYSQGKTHAVPCSAHDLNFGGECFNCGYRPHRIVTAVPYVGKPITIRIGG